MHQLDIADPRAAHAALRSLKTLALADGDLDPRERALLESCREVLRVDDPLEALAPIAPDELAAALPSEEARRALVQRMVLLSFQDEALPPEELSLLRAFARALRVDEPALEQMDLFARGRYRLLALHLMRHGFLREPFRQAWEKHGMRGLLRLLRAATNRPDPAEAARYEALGTLPEGTLGRALHAYWRSNGFAIPGEPGGVPDVMLFHDIGHVLTGYGTDPGGEFEMAGFEAGYMRKDGFSVAVLALLIFQVGAPLPRVQPTRGAFDLARFLAAWERGRALGVDLRNWDAAPWMETPVEQVRAALATQEGPHAS